MKLTDEQVLHVAKLARLALGADELVTYREQLSAILEAVDQLAQVDTTGIPATSALGSAEPHQRDDLVQGEVGTRVALANAPRAEGSHFAIPKVIE